MLATIRNWSILLMTLLLSACITEESFENTPEGNFEALWKIIDEHYCFLDYKNQEYGLDWNQIHTSYKQRITANMNSKELFDVLSEMLNELRDGHVNLVSKDRVSQYRRWYDSYPRNFSDSIQSVYLGKDYYTASGLKYCILEDNIAYIYCGSFEYSLGSGNLDQILQALAPCNGLILDVRNNGGGVLTTADKLAGRFTNERLLVGYISYKEGPEHQHFSKPQPIYLEPSTSNVRWQKKTVILTNRRSYSATNDFVNKMRYLPNVTIVGDKTGGGSGLPFTSELPNGWSVRFSASPIYDVDMQHLEFGINPDVKVDITSEDYNRNVDTIIETARDIIQSSL
ncbi:MAG: S41 family peptidase [Phocaeicola sp.]|nr:S41 family peptidase [Phocaeicola sp.]